MYATWKVTELKAELKRRGASLRGKKADLVERLNLYDKNFNFGRLEYVDEEEPPMALPPNDSFKDINSNTILPPVNKSQIRFYLNCTEKKFKAALDLYESRHLVTARASVVGDTTYIKGSCRKTMKKLMYVVQIKLKSTGIYSGTPVRAEKLPKKRSGVRVIFKPYPTEKLDLQNYNHRIRNLVLNFKNSTMPMKQLYEPANTYGIVNDHVYTTPNPEDVVLNNLKVLKISKEDIKNIEISTRDQVLSSEWHYQHKIRITASNFHTVCHLKPSTKAKYAEQLAQKIQNFNPEPPIMVK
ncbi:uncharacterized protein LOC125225785 [Leguminivora glycinivorella]|uniref:uncharacterized protein LOC125225785 n=1 Tax=Leguminivora glycinivorella TaxID=1035111 RepID=UPI00200CC1CC|nr:uncharacterized protein LOC125225785 [Leguminivora glycinivorella]